MKIALITCSISPHQLPLANELVRHLGAENFRYISDESLSSGRAQLGWSKENIPDWVLIKNSSEETKKECIHWSINADVILCGLRETELFKKRSSKGMLTLYMSERWFKPPFGILRLLYPPFLIMAWRVYKLLKSSDFYYLPLGIHAATDMARMCGLFNLEIKFLWKKPNINSEKHNAMSKIICSSILNSSKERTKIIAPKNENHLLLNKMRIWGYFVEKTSGKKNIKSGYHENLNILWAGRMLRLKKVNTLILAVKTLVNNGLDIKLTIVGKGPQVNKLKRIAFKKNNGEGFKTEFGVDFFNCIKFLPSVPIAEVRKLMRSSDIYVLPSNSNEGWGAVINEAMEEGCVIIASRQSGAGITLIQDNVNGLLFNSGERKEIQICIQRLYNDRNLIKKLGKEAECTMATSWGVEKGAELLIDFIISEINIV